LRYFARTKPLASTSHSIPKNAHSLVVSVQAQGIAAVENDVRANVSDVIKHRLQGTQVSANVGDRGDFHRSST
jgi:hypothetical protein